MIEQFKQLLPCAHCNSGAILVEDEDYEPYIFHYVTCTHCGIRTKTFFKHECIKVWNTRAPIQCEHEFADIDGVNISECRKCGIDYKGENNG